MEKNDVEREEMGEESKEILGRKRPRKTAGSKTYDDNPSCSCLNMAATIEAIIRNWIWLYLGSRKLMT